MFSDPPNEFCAKQAQADSGRERRRDPRYPMAAEARVIDGNFKAACVLHFA
jgi:hypothetical protein